MHFGNGEKMRLFIRFSILAILSALLFISCSTDEPFNGSFFYSPDHIKPGDEIVIKYNPDSSNLAGKEDIELIAYLYGTDLNNTVDIPLINKSSIYSGNLKTDENTLGVILKFLSGDDLDNNNGEGYVIFLNDDKGRRIAGSLAGYGAALNRWGAYYAELDRDKEKAYRFIVEDFKENPGIKSKYLHTYFEVISSIKPEKKDNIIKKELDALAKVNPSEEKEVTVLANWYEKMGEKETAAIYENQLLDNYPGSEFAERLKIKEFKKEEDVGKKIDLARNFEKLFPESGNVKYLYDVITNVFRNNKEYDKALKFLRDNVNKPSTYRFYSVVNRMLDENDDMTIAIDLSNLGVERAGRELENPSERKPEYLSESEWLMEREYNLGLNYFGKGKVLYRLDRREEALTALQEAVRYTKEKDDMINELYAKSLIENGRYDFAMSKISEFITSGYSTAQMKTYLKEAYLNEKGTEDGFEAFAAQFEDAAKEKLIEKLKNEMFLEAAPLFTLNDIEGNEVSLKEYKGSTVIVDFWATWCGPCLASFPGMKQAVEKYQDDDHVKFLFVNTWERTDDKQKNAAEFIVKNEYPFHVLMDEENKVIEMYKVSGIPTKFVIDGEGNIRFKSVGFTGSDDKLVEELSTMISMVK
jgi:peroxiredoxin